MPISFLPVRDTVPQYAVFGKLPEEADFIRMGASSHPSVLEFDALLSRSLAHSARQADWNEARCLRTGISEFQFTTHDRRWCYFGALLPSVDKAGRLYPLVAGIILPAHVVLPVTPELAIANELFFAGLRKRLPAVHDATELSVSCQRFLADQCTPDGNAQEELDLAGQMLSRHLTQVTASQLQTRLDDSGLPPLDDILMAFVYQADLIRSQGTGAPRQAIPLPLSGEEGEVALDQAAWLALCRAAVGKNRSADFIISNQRQLTLAPNRFSERCLGALWGMPTEPVLAEPPWHRQGGWAEVAWKLGKQLHDPGLTLDKLLPSLERIAGNAK